MQNNVRYRQMVKQKKERLKANPNPIPIILTILQVYPGHLSKTRTICFWPIAWLVVYFLLDSRLYPFLTPNWPGIPVFGYWPLYYWMALYQAGEGTALYRPLCSFFLPGRGWISTVPFFRF